MSGCMGSCMAIDDAKTHAIIGAAMEVHNVLGSGFQEVVYQRALAVELRQRDIRYRREQEVPLLYKGRTVGSRRADFIVDKTLLLEIKAVSQLEDVHLAQALNYLTAYDLPIGLLINFGNTRLQFKRLYRKERT